MIQIARNIDHLGREFPVFSYHLKARSALQQVFASDHKAVIGDEETGAPIGGLKAQLPCIGLAHRQGRGGNFHARFFGSRNGFGKMGLFAG